MAYSISQILFQWCPNLIEIVGRFKLKNKVFNIFIYFRIQKANIVFVVIGRCGDHRGGQKDIFVDPEWQQKMEIMLMLGPQNPGKAGSGNSPTGAQQNKGNPQARPIPTPTQDFNQQSQSAAAVAQSTNQGVI